MKLICKTNSPIYIASIDKMIRPDMVIDVDDHVGRSLIAQQTFIEVPAKIKAKGVKS